MSSQIMTVESWTIPHGRTQAPVYGRLPVFVLGLALCGLAPNLPVLIAFRILQAIGAAMLSSNSVTIIVAASGPERRGRALGIQSAAQAAGLSAGPALGGLVLDTLGWQWVFWINVPVGLVGAVIGWLVIPLTNDTPDDGRFDWKGAFLIMPALTTLMAGLNEAYAWGVPSPPSPGVRCSR
jgi:MFS family permease